MGFKPDWPTVEPSKLGDDFKSWRDGLAYPVQKALNRLRDMTNGGLTVTDNMNSAIVTFKLTHGSELPFKSQSFRPRGFTVLSVLDDGGNVGFPVAGSPVINYNRTDKTDGWFGLTVNYALPVGEMFTVVKTSNETIATASNLLVSFVAGTGSSNDSKGTALSFNGTNGITVNKTGLYTVCAELCYSNTSVAGDRSSAIKIDGANIIAIESGASPSFFTQHNLTGTIAVAAGSVFTVNAFQNSGVALTMNGGAASVNRLSGATNRCWLQATRIRNDETPTYNVTGILWGG